MLQSSRDTFSYETVVDPKPYLRYIYINVAVLNIYCFISNINCQTYHCFEMEVARLVQFVIGSEVVIQREFELSYSTDLV